MNHTYTGTRSPIVSLAIAGVLETLSVPRASALPSASFPQDPILSDSPSFRDSRSSLFAPRSSSAPLRNSLVVVVESFVRYRKLLFKFDALVAALPLTEDGEEAQLQKISELQAKNDAIGQELQKQLEAAEKELRQVQELFGQAADNCLNLKKPD